MDYSNFCKKDPEQTEVDELRAYFQSMFTDGNHKPGSVKMKYYALRFLFTNICHKEWAKEYLPTPKVAKTLPVVFSQPEINLILKTPGLLKHRVLFAVIYDCGLRISEAIRMGKIISGKARKKWKIIREN